MPRGIAYMKDEHIILFDKEPLAAVDAVPEPARHLFDMSPYIYSDYSHNGTTLRKPYATMITEALGLAVCTASPIRLVSAVSVIFTETRSPDWFACTWTWLA